MGKRNGWEGNIKILQGIISLKLPETSQKQKQWSDINLGRKIGGKCKTAGMNLCRAGGLNVLPK